MPRLSLPVRNLILKLDKAGLKQSQIQDEIFTLDGVFISRVTIAYWIRRGREGGTLGDLPRRHVEPKLDAVHLDFIEKLMQEDNETTAMETCAKLQNKFAINVSKEPTTRLVVGSLMCQRQQ